MNTYKIAVIAGDGIGKEVIPAGIEVIKMAAEQGGFQLDFTDIPWGCDYYLQHGRMLDADGVAQAAEVRRHLPRRHRRPARAGPHLGARADPAAAPAPRAVREPAADAAAARHHLAAGQPRRRRHRHDLRARELRGRVLRHRRAAARRHADELAEQTGIFTRHGIERIARYAFKLAQSRPRKMLASATKSNALQHAMVLWDEVVADVAKEFPDVELKKYHVDALCARMVTHPQTLDVIVASNLFGDILTDIGSAISGSLGVAPGGNINPDRTTPSMFEPIHGSAPDIAGKGIANPIAAIWAGAMMLDHLGDTDSHDRILAAIEKVISDGNVKTPDLGGKATTAEMTKAVRAAMS